MKKALVKDDGVYVDGRRIADAVNVRVKDKEVNLAVAYALLERNLRITTGNTGYIQPERGPHGDIIGLFSLDTAALDADEATLDDMQLLGHLDNILVRVTEQYVVEISEVIKYFILTNPRVKEEREREHRALMQDIKVAFAAAGLDGTDDEPTKH